MHRFNCLLILLISTAPLMGMQNNTPTVKVRPDVLINQKIEAFDAMLSWKNYFLILGASAAAGGLLWSYAHAQQKINSDILQQKQAANDREFQQKQLIMPTIVPVFIQMGKQKPIPSAQQQAIGTDVAKYIRTFLETEPQARAGKTQLHEQYQREFISAEEHQQKLKALAFAIPLTTFMAMGRIRSIKNTIKLFNDWVITPSIDVTSHIMLGNFNKALRPAFWLSLACYYIYITRR